MKLTKNNKIAIGILILIILAVAVWIIFMREDSPADSQETMEELLERLTPNTTMTSEEVEEMNNLLFDLTPRNQGETSNQNREEIEELLQNLTPIQ